MHSRRRTGAGDFRVAGALLIATAVALSGCSLLQPPASGPTGPGTAEEPVASSGPADSAGQDDGNQAAAEDSLRRVAAERGLDEEEVVGADRRARESVAALERETREEFRRLFGSDPLGLARMPSNAGKYEIPLETNRAVEWWIDYFRNEIPERFELYLRRASRYESMIRSKLREAGLPEDLLYLAVIESGMNPDAYSRARAVGMWQFIASTARRYGLEISYWVDERRDPVASTEAAIEHLSDLYEEFGSWYLAAAAYNAGPGRVRWGIARTGSRDYWDLVDARVLRRETRNYVPKLIAAALIAKDPASYGFEVDPSPTLEYETVTVPQATSLDVIARAAEVTQRAVERLNPSYRRGVTPPGRESTVRVPAGHGERFAANYAEIPSSERVSWLVHTVTRGQTLSHIARRYGTSIRAIVQANDGLRPRRLQIGQRVLVPRMGRGDQATSGRGLQLEGPATVVVRRGDTLWSIARRYDVSTRELMAWNDLESPLIRPGDRIEVRR